MFSQTAEYALRAMYWLALSPKTLVPTALIAERTNVPSHYLAKVLQQLATSRLIEGRRGVRGGYRLSRPAGEITLLEIVRAVNPTERRRPMDTLEGLEDVLEPLYRRMDRAAQAVTDVFENVTLEDLLNESSQGFLDPKDAREAALTEA